MQQSTLKVRSLSPAYWYVCDVGQAKREKCRGQVSEAFATRAEADKAIIRMSRSR